MVNHNYRETLASCLRQIFGAIDDRFVDAALPLVEWRQLAGGETLLREGDRADGVYFVISGRLRAYSNADGERRVMGEIGRGETVGEMGVLTNELRTATVVAVRDSVLAFATRASFETLLQIHPQLPIHMARIIIDRVKRTARPAVRKPSTIALLPITDDVNVRALTGDLVRELRRWGSVAALTREDGARTPQVAEWLDEVEFAHNFVVLVADDRDDEWSRRCLRQADEVLLLARADAPVATHAMEARLAQSATPARQTLVLLHDAATRHPSGTARWLDRRPVDAHVHIRPALERDMARLARIVSGNAIGLVLAGGGARGFAHLGVFRALQQAGVEIDYVGGTSMGAIMAACISLDRPADELTSFVRTTFARNPTGDVNLLPLLSLIKGERIKIATAKAVSDLTGSRHTDIADSWKTLFLVASNYSRAKEMVITRGPLERAVRASLSIPVALPPVMWDGELLVDGAVFNNFPADIMARFGARRIIGVDLSRRNLRRYDFDEIPGTWQLLWDRLRGRRRRYKLPTLGALLMRTTILYSESRVEQAREMVDLYLNPDVSRVGLLDWKSCDDIVSLGYAYGREALAALSREELEPYVDAGAFEVEMSA